MTRALKKAAALVVFVACSKHARPDLKASDADSGSLHVRVDTASDAGTPQAEDPRFPARLAALAWEVKVHDQPALQSPMVGSLRAGAVVRAGAEPVSRESCSGGWYAVAPAGFVCVE